MATALLPQQFEHVLELFKLIFRDEKSGTTENTIALQFCQFNRLLASAWYVISHHS
jgi:hypothetical protein